jgi:hypothetical protein
LYLRDLYTSQNKQSLFYTALTDCFIGFHNRGGECLLCGGSWYFNCKSVLSWPLKGLINNLSCEMS